MKKVLFATHSPFYIGGEKSMWDVLKGLKKFFNVAILVQEGELYEMAKREGIRVYKLPQQNSPLWETKRKIFLPLFKKDLPKILKGLNKILKDFNPDIIYTHSMKMHLFFSLPFLKKEKKLVWHFRDIPWESSKFLFKIFSFFPDRIIAISESVKKFFPKKSKFRVIYNGIKIPEKIEENKIKKKRFTVLSVGNIQYWKAQDLIVECAKRLKEFDFWIVGDSIHPGEEKFKKKIIEKIKKENIKNVFLFGKRNDVFSFYKECDIFLHIPRKPAEGFGRVVVEAMAMKKPVIVSDNGALPEIVKDTGLIVKSNNLNDICEKILIYYKNESLRKEMGEKGFIRYKSLFTPERMIEGVLKCLRELI